MKLTKTNLIALSAIFYLFIFANSYSQSINLLHIKSSKKQTDIQLKLSDKQSFLKLKKDKVSYPVFDLHVAVGVAHGFRIGARMKIKHFSFETAYGVSFDVLAANGKTAYTFGANWYPLEKYWFFMSLIFTYLRDPIHPENYGIIYSINMGAITIDTSKLLAFLRVGGFVYFETSRNGLNKETFFYPNIDLGIGYRFSF